LIKLGLFKYKNSSGDGIANVNFLLHSCRWKFTYIFKHFYTVRRESYRIRWNNAE